MTKHTPASVEKSLGSKLLGFKEDANAVKQARTLAVRAIKDDPMRSDLAKKTALEDLSRQTRSQLDAVRGKQDWYVKSLREEIARELCGDQPTDANSVLLRRDAADRARKLADQNEAMTVLQDAIFNGDDSLAHAIGGRARNAAWLGVAEAYQAAHPSTADSAQALAIVEANTSGAAYNLSNGITYSAPSD